jgi:DnaJ-class molecular chaperone
VPNKYEKHYRILELDVGASKGDVKKAFRELSHIWHPDNHMGKSSNVQNRSNEKFKELSSAYQVLIDYLEKESSSSRESSHKSDSAREAEEKRRADQDRRDKEEKEWKQKKEDERRKQEEQNRKKAEIESIGKS